MNAPEGLAPIEEINRLHDEVTRLTAESNTCLHRAVIAAWQAGHLLLVEQKRVLKTMGGAWGQWLTRYFHGSHRTAQNYMRLAASVADMTTLKGMNLRQVYLRLGIATEPKSSGGSVRVKAFPSYLRLAGRLSVALKVSGKKLPPEKHAIFRQDLHPLYAQLWAIFDGVPPNNYTATFSNQKK